LSVRYVDRSRRERSGRGVRRHVKRDDDSVSLVQILSQMKDRAPELTFDFYLQQFPRNDADGFFWQKPTFKLASENGVPGSDAVAALSVGTRDQLATLIRLTIAEKLKSAYLAAVAREDVLARPAERRVSVLLEMNQLAITLAVSGSHVSSSPLPRNIAATGTTETPSTTVISSSAGSPSPEVIPKGLLPSFSKLGRHLAPPS
jgi:hypothetical protein